MRETIEEGETIEKTLSRGLKEEFGATGKLSTYVGSLTKPYQVRDITVQKTTLYFLVELIDINESARMPNDPEAGSIIEWLKPEDLAVKMKSSATKLGLPDMDESEVIDRVVKLGII